MVSPTAFLPRRADGDCSPAVSEPGNLNSESGGLLPPGAPSQFTPMVYVPSLSVNITALSQNF